MGLSLGDAHLTLAEKITQDLRERILSRRLESGQRLTEERLAEEYGVSRVPVREALQLLLADGLVERKPRVGFSVIEHNEDEIDDLMAVSAALDPILFGKLQKKLDEKAILALETVLEEAEEAIRGGKNNEARYLNAKFHRLCRELTDSPFLAGLVSTVETRLTWLMMQHDEPAVFVRQHKQILDALIAGDEEVIQQAITEHTRLSLASLQAFRN